MASAQDTLVRDDCPSANLGGFWYFRRVEADTIQFGKGVKTGVWCWSTLLGSITFLEDKLSSKRSIIHTLWHKILTYETFVLKSVSVNVTHLTSNSSKKSFSEDLQGASSLKNNPEKHARTHTHTPSVTDLHHSLVCQRVLLGLEVAEFCRCCLYATWRPWAQETSAPAPALESRACRANRSLVRWALGSVRNLRSQSSCAVQVEDHIRSRDSRLVQGRIIDRSSQKSYCSSKWH